MHSDFLREYKRLRALGWIARDSFNAARSNTVFEKLERRGLVKFEVELDQYDKYDSSFVDTWSDKTPEERAKIRKELDKRAEDEGLYSVLSYVLIDGDWEIADSCGGFIGKDWKDSCYDDGIRQSAIDLIGCCMNASHSGFGEPQGECEDSDCVVSHVLGS